MIRKAVRKDIPNLKKITEACARHMIAQGIFQWNEQYPSVAVFQKDIEQENMYVFELDEKLAGCVMLSFHKDDFYDFGDPLLSCIVHSNETLYMGIIIMKKCTAN